MENYISTVLNKIENKKVKADIQAELEDHYNERVEYYTRIGYDKETAEAKANEHFGEDAEIVGEQIDLVNQKHTLLSVIFAIINVGLLLFPIVFWMLALFFVADHFHTSYLGLIISVVLSVFYFTELLVSLKNRTEYLSILSALSFVFLGIFNMGYSPIVFCVYKAFKGELNSYVDLLYHFDWSCTNKAVYICFIVFYVLCIALSIFSGILIYRFKQCKYSKKNLKQEKVLKILLFSLILISLICLISALVYPHDRDYSDWKSLDGVYVIESDEMIHPQKISDYDHNHLYIHWDLFDSQDAHYDSDSFVTGGLGEEEITERYDEDVVFYYTNFDLYGKFQPTKKYVCVIPIYNGAPKFSEYYWVETSEEYVFESERDSSHIKYEIEILPRENGVGE